LSALPLFLTSDDVVRLCKSRGDRVLQGTIPGGFLCISCTRGIHTYSMYTKVHFFSGLSTGMDTAYIVKSLEVFQDFGAKGLELGGGFHQLLLLLWLILTSKPNFLPHLGYRGFSSLLEIEN
jgi:hypothetical protein